jgi:hypothetical protein
VEGGGETAKGNDGEKDAREGEEENELEGVETELEELRGVAKDLDERLTELKAAKEQVRCSYNGSWQQVATSA